jgi:adenosine deaminase
VNSDDPAYFGGYVAENYLAAFRALVLSRADIVQLASNSFEASFLPQAEKEGWLAQVRRFNAAAPAASA